MFSDNNASLSHSLSLSFSLSLFLSVSIKKDDMKWMILYHNESLKNSSPIIHVLLGEEMSIVTSTALLKKRVHLLNLSFKVTIPFFYFICWFASEVASISLIFKFRWYTDDISYNKSINEVKIYRIRRRKGGSSSR